MIDENVEFGGRLFQARMRAAAKLGRHISRSVVADLMGTNHKRVALHETGAREPSLHTIRRYAIILGVDPGWLAFGTVRDHQSFVRTHRIPSLLPNTGASVFQLPDRRGASPPPSTNPPAAKQVIRKKKRRAKRLRRNLPPAE
jgi:hypothetical protein